MSNDSANDSGNNPNDTKVLIAGANTLFLNDDVSHQELTDLARSLQAEMDQDPELKTDVVGLSDTDAQETLDQLKMTLESAELERVHQLSETVEILNLADEALNAVQIEEDRILEAQAAAQESTEESTQETPDEARLELLGALPKRAEDGSVDLDDLQACIQAFLFMSDRPVSLKKIQEWLELESVDEAPFLAAITNLKNEYEKPIHGVFLAEVAGGYQLRTKPNRAALIRKLAKVQVQRLSRGAMETLSLIAYKQPAKKEDVDQIRGVDSSHFIRTLLDRKLIEVVGRSDDIGRPMLYSTTDTFLEVFNLMSLDDLPPLREIEAMVPQIASAGEEDPRVVQMRKMVQSMKLEDGDLSYNAKDDEQILQEIREKVKTIDVTSPYLERQKELATQGIVGEEAEELLAQEFGFAQPARSDARDADLAGAAIGTPITEQSEIDFEQELKNHNFE